MEKSSNLSRRELVPLVPVVVNIFRFLVFLDPPGLPLAVMVRRSRSF
jgi:hypothetical protein